MALLDDLKNEVAHIFGEQWTTREGQVVPDPEDLKLSNDAIILKRATVLYADLKGSTKLVNAETWEFSAEIYKTFLHCAAKIIRQENGDITSYDGDRIMAIFLGGDQSNDATRCGLKINYAVKNIIQPALKKQYPSRDYTIRHAVGIDTGKIHAARTGVRGDNDIVWVGRAPNFGAKLTEIDRTESTWLTKDVYDLLKDAQKLGGDPKRNMWTAYTWNEQGGISIYASSWTWKV